MIRKTILSLLWGLFMLPLLAAEADEPILTFKTHRYDVMGEDNQVSFSMMPRLEVGSTSVEVDFGYGRHSYTIEYDGVIAEDDSLETLIGGTTIAGKVSAEGVVRVYGTATDIDYLDIHGSEVYDIDLAKFTNLMILSLAHNEIEKLDVSMMPKMQYLDLKDNPFNKGLTIGSNHPDLYYLNVNKLGDNALASGTIDLSGFSNLQVFTAWDSKCLKTLDVTHNTKLLQLSIDNSGVTTLDVTKNSQLLILNVSDCGMNTLDVSKNPYLVELYTDNEGQAEASRKLSALDVSKNKHLQRIFCNGNRLTTLDISNQNNLVSLYASSNYLTELKGLEKVDSLAYLDVSVNCFDFATMPDVDPMTYFYYVLQRQMQVETEYKVGSVLDMSSRVVRNGEAAYCALALIPSSGIEDPVLLTEGDDYTYAEGRITFLKPQSEHVVAYFYNEAFPDVTLQTTEFWVRSESDFGQPVTHISFVPKGHDDGSDIHVSFAVGIEPSLAQEQILVNFGGVSTTYSLTEGNTFHVEGVATGSVTISGRIEMPIISFVLNNTPLESIDLSSAHYLTQLDLSGDSLASIDLGWNNQLSSLVLTGNKLSHLDLTGVNDAHHKNVLTHVDVSDNELVSFVDNVGVTIEYLNLSNNKFKEMEFSEFSSLRYLNLSNNQLSSLNVDSCESLTELHIEDNAFRLSTLPQISVASYCYAPQKPMTISSHSMLVSLASEAVVNGIATDFVWKDINSGAILVEGTDYTVNDAKFVFLEPAVGKDVCCVLSNTTFPAFDSANPFCTTAVRVMGKPDYTVATFTTPVGGQHGMLSLAGKHDNTYIYIDWGNDDMVEYPLQSMYTLFTTETIEGATVKVYSYEASDGNIQVFSLDSISMTNVDVSKMTDVYCLALCNAGLESLDLSKNTGVVELNLEGNKFKSIDLSNNPNIYYLVLANNKLSSIDLSHQDNLGWLVLSDNSLRQFDATNLSHLYALSLTRNNLTEIDMSAFPELRQISIAENQLTHIDLSQHPVMEIVDISMNKFTLATLPLPTTNYMIYNYGNQEPVEIECVDGKIDLSDMAEIGGVATNYYWFEGEMDFYYDDDDNLQMSNIEYIEGTDFFVENGVTTFAEAHEGVTGYIQNELFPNILLFTQTIPVTADTAIEEVKETTASDVRYNLYGQHVEKAKGLTISQGVKTIK